MPGSAWQLCSHGGLSPAQCGASMAPSPLMMSPVSPATGKPPGDAGCAQGAHVLQSLPGACLPAALVLVGSCCPTCGRAVAFRRRAQVAPGSTPGRSSPGFSPVLSAEAGGFGAGEHPFFWHRLVVKFLQVSEMRGTASTAAITALFQDKKQPNFFFFFLSLFRGRCSLPGCASRLGHSDLGDLSLVGWMMEMLVGMGEEHRSSHVHLLKPCPYLAVKASPYYVSHFPCSE